MGMRGSQPRRGASPHLSPWVRGCYGLVLLMLPGPLLHLVAGHVCGTVPRRVVRLLAARHVAQAVLTLGHPSRATRAVGVEVDLAHAASMLAVAAIDRRYSRPAGLDAVTATTLAVAGVADTIRFAAPTRPHGTLARHRDAAAARVAAHTLPARVRARLVDPRSRPSEPVTWSARCPPATQPRSNTGSADRGGEHHAPGGPR